MRILPPVVAFAAALTIAASAQADPTPSIHYGFDECVATGTTTSNVVAGSTGDPVLSCLTGANGSVLGSSVTSGDCGLQLNAGGGSGSQWARAASTTRSYYQADTTGPNANSLTLSADVKVSATGSAWQWLAGDDLCNETGDISDGSCIGYALYAATPNNGGAPSAYVKLATLTGNELLGVVGSDALTDHLWHNLTMTYTTGTLKLYIDGALDNTSTTTLTGTPSVISGNSALGVFTVGGQHINGNPGEPLFGTADNVRFYKQALTTTEVSHIQP